MLLKQNEHIYCIPFNFKQKLPIQLFDCVELLAFVLPLCMIFLGQNYETVVARSVPTAAVES